MSKKTRNIVRISVLGSITALIVLTIWFNLSNDQTSANVGDDAIDFQLTNLDGENVQLSEILEEKGVVINFWGTWCKPCREEMPDLNDLYINNEEDVEVLAVNVAENSQQINQFTSSLPSNLTFPILMDKDRDVTRAYNIGPLPTTIAINQDGEIVRKQESQLTQEDILAFFDDALSSGE